MRQVDAALHRGAVRIPGVRAVKLVARVLRGAIPVTLAALLAGCSSPAFETGRLGAVHLAMPRESPRGTIFLFSGEGGWDKAEADAANRLAEAGAIVVGVDLESYRRALDASDGECLYLLSEIESLSQQVQRRAGATDYDSPVLAGIAEGGALARAAVAQSPAATVAGAIAVDPSASVRTRLPLCPGAPATRGPKGFEYGASASMPGFVSVAFTSRADEAGRASIRNAVSGGEPTSIVSDIAPDRSASSVLTDLAVAHLDAPVAARQARADIDPSLARSIIEMPAHAASPTVVVIVSGDGGWRDLDKTIAGHLNDRGIAVVGWDSLRYFWRERSADEFGADLDAVVRRYADQWHASEVVLVGFSFGADVLPSAYNRLSPQVRAMVRQISLLAFSGFADFEIHISGWIGGGPTPDAVPAAPELAKIPGALVQCFYGEDEEKDETACPALVGAGVEVIQMKGDHHLGRDYEAVTKRILDGLARRRAAPAGGRAP